MTKVGSLDEPPYEPSGPKSTRLLAGALVFHVIVAAVFDGVTVTEEITSPAVCGAPLHKVPTAKIVVARMIARAQISARDVDLGLS